MVKVFDTISDFEAYVLGGMVAGDLYYVLSDGSVHFRTNNIDGKDTVYKMNPEPVLIEGEFTENGTYEPEEADGYSSAVVNVPIPAGYIVPTGAKSITENGEAIDVAQYATVNVSVAAPTPQYTALNLNTLPAKSDGKHFSTLISATLGQTIEIYNPNHLEIQVGQGQPAINPVDGEIDGYVIFQNGICSIYDTGTNDTGIIYLEHLYATNAPNIYEGGYSELGFAITYYSAAGTPVDGVIYYRIIDDSASQEDSEA